MGDGCAPLPAALLPGAAPCRHWDEATVHRRLTADPAGYLAFARDCLADLAAGRAHVQMPPKLVLDDPLDDLGDDRGGGDFRLMPCVRRGPRGVLKTVKIIGTNRAQRLLPGQITVGELLVLDAAEQCVIDRFEACLLSSARTGLVAALALAALAPQARRIAIVGAGRVGYYAAIYCAAALPLTRIELVDTDAARAEDTAQALRYLDVLEREHRFLGGIVGRGRRGGAAERERAGGQCREEGSSDHASRSEGRIHRRYSSATAPSLSAQGSRQ